MSRILLTGASGFVGSHVLEHLLVSTQDDIVCPVSFRHLGMPLRLEHVLASRPEHAHRVRVVMHDLTAPIDPRTADAFGDVDQVWNIASQSHVDRSISDPGPFIRNNVDLMTNMIDWAREAKPSLFLHMSTDEVYGPAHGGHRHVEWETHKPSNPYAASKSVQESIAFAAWRTYGLPVVITNTMNIIGERQDREKFLPLVIGRILRGERIDVHASPEGVPGSRFYLHARNLADAWDHLSTRAPALYANGAGEPDRYHIVGEREVDNVTLVRMVHDAVKRHHPGTVPAPDVHLMSFHAARPGHDLRYALDGAKLAGTGWTAPVGLDESLDRTVRWYLNNRSWL